MTAESNRQAIDAMMQQIEDAKPSEEKVYAIRNPKVRSSRALAAMALAVGGAPADNRAARFAKKAIDNIEARRSADAERVRSAKRGSEATQADRIAAAQGKRDRRLASRRQRGEAE